MRAPWRSCRPAARVGSSSAIDAIADERPGLVIGVRALARNALHIETGGRRCSDDGH